MLPTYTVHRVLLDGSLTSKEHLNDAEEMREWVMAAYGRFAAIQVVNDLSGEVRIFTDNGDNWARVA